MEHAVEQGNRFAPTAVADGNHLHIIPLLRTTQRCFKQNGGKKQAGVTKYDYTLTRGLPHFCEVTGLNRRHKFVSEISAHLQLSMGQDAAKRFKPVAIVDTLSNHAGTWLVRLNESALSVSL